MDYVHSKYNLTFKNEEINNLWIKKTVEFINRANKDFTPLKFYLYLIQDSGMINEILIDPDKIINGDIGYSISLGSENIEVNSTNIEIHDLGYVNIIPVTDFKGFCRSMVCF